MILNVPLIDLTGRQKVTKHTQMKTPPLPPSEGLPRYLGVINGRELVIHELVFDPTELLV